MDEKNKLNKESAEGVSGGKYFVTEPITGKRFQVISNASSDSVEREKSQNKLLLNVPKYLASSSRIKADYKKIAENLGPEENENEIQKLTNYF